MTVPDLKVKLFADGADVAGMVEMYRRPWIKGFTTNPTLMRKAGVSDYRAFAREVLAAIPDRPISFEVFSDDFDEMARQAREIASWGANVNVKIPVTNTRGAPSYELIRELSAARIMLNVTAVFTLDQVRDVVAHLDPATPAYVSVFAGRVADTGRDPMPHMAAALKLAKLRLDASAKGSVIIKAEAQKQRARRATKAARPASTRRTAKARR
jgi:transaldolase